MTAAADSRALAAFVAYLLLIIAIGVYATRFSSAGVSEFFIGGRRMNRFVVALSAVVSGRSAWLLLGVTGMAYAMGASAVWAVLGYITVEFFLFLYYAPRLRRFSARYDCITVPDFFAARFEDERGTLRTVLVVVIHQGVRIGPVGWAYYPDTRSPSNGSNVRLPPACSRRLESTDVRFRVSAASTR